MNDELGSTGNNRSASGKVNPARLGTPRGESDDFDLGELASLIEHSPDRPVDRRLTEEEVEQALAALQRAHENSAKLSARYGGITFPCSVEIIHEMREERTRQLMANHDPREMVMPGDEPDETP